MRAHIKNLLLLHSPKVPVKGTFMSALGIFVSMVAVILVKNNFDFPSIYAPLGATAFLIFYAPGALYSQPINVIIGNAVCASIAVIFLVLHLDSPILIAFATALGAFLMVYFRVPHPPAAGFPLMFLLYKPDAIFTFFSIICASIITIIGGIIYHKLVRNEYPIRITKSRL